MTVAARTASDMSSGLTRMAGGGWLPIRWRAASTSAITPRRRSSECESSSAVALRLANLSAAAAAPRSASCTLAVVSISAAEGAPDRRERSRFRPRSPGAAPPMRAACPRRRAARSPCPRAADRSGSGGFEGARDRRARRKPRRAKRPKRPSARNLSMSAPPLHQRQGSPNLANIGAIVSFWPQAAEFRRTDGFVTKI